MILKGSRKAAERALASMSKFIEDKLFLKVNRDKSFVAHISDDVKYLGYAFYRSKGELRFRPRAKSIAKLKGKVSAILARSNGWSLDFRRYRLRCLVMGWVGYFKLADMKSVLASVWTSGAAERSGASTGKRGRGCAPSSGRCESWAWRKARHGSGRTRAKPTGGLQAAGCSHERSTMQN